LNKAFATYYNHVLSQPAEVILYLSKNISLIESNQELFSKEELVLTKCKIAEMYYMNSEFEKAYNEYSVIFEKDAKDLANDFYHHAKYVQVALLNDKYDKAKELIDNRFLLFIESKQPSTGVMGCLLYAKFYFFTKQYAEANKYIQLAKRLISKSFYIQYELEIRILETTYFIMINDLKSAKSLIKKNVKFMNSKGFNLKNSEMIYVFVILQEVINPGFSSDKMGVRLESKYNLMQKSYAAIYGKLLKEVIAHVEKIQEAILKATV
jgi:tetratricopeptide (TPR) repeat protein